MKRPDPIEEQAQRVRDAYDRTGDRNPEFERESDKLHDMRLKKMAQEFRAERGLPPDARTPYCPREDSPDPAGAPRLYANAFGLDVPYFSEVVRRELSDLSNKRPEELARICLRIAETACSPVMAEPEFVRHFVSAAGLEGDHLLGDAGLGRLMRRLKSVAPAEWGVKLSLDENGFSLFLVTPDQHEQLEASGLQAETGSLRTALACLILSLQSGDCMREFVDRASSQTPEQVRQVIWELALEEGGDAAARALISDFQNFDAFEEWFETLEHYEMQDGDHELTAADRAALRIAFQQLRVEIDLERARMSVASAFDQPSICYESIPAGLSPR